ncbi:hydantoinase/oxoprolinase family protein [Bacillus sp. JJ1532]|uniref:hydantoinase/oxoprolinase family protein n=1 Tax=Bacillus sp. JJ1532 TaxID=3122958 RepID=UPI002FFFB458
MSTIRVGIDIGGTFTDIVFIDEEGNRMFGKTLTTYPDPSEGFLKGLNENLIKYGYSYSDIKTIIHGTTLVVNALIQRKGVKTAFITTKGFRDQLEIGNENRYDLYDLFIDKPAPLVPRRLRFTVTERILANGELLQPLDEEEVREVFKEMLDQKVEAAAVCLIHGYKNPVHEKRILEIAQEVAPSIRVSLSSEVSPEIRELQRASTTIANVYVQPLVESYLTKLEKDLKSRGFTGHFHMMLSGGGTCTIETACRFPIRILESGPVGGTIAGAHYSKISNISNLLVFDMGGTTAKASLVDNGEPIITNEFEVGRESRFKKGSGIPVKVPVVEMIEIGAGGGSIAYINRMNLIKVGPISASSVPGPACYGKGGNLPTVTDADLVLGYLNPDFFLGGEMPLDVDAAYKSIEEHVAKPLGLSVTEAAWGIHHIVNENMASAARIHAVEKGKDIRNYPLFATGGAGPVHACNVANILDVSTVISPVGAGVCSAFGFLASPIAFDFVRSYHGRLDQLNLQEVTDLLVGMEKEGESLLTQSGIKHEDLHVIRKCEMRYVGQSYEISVPIPNGELNEDSIEMIRSNFKHQYEKLYSEASDAVPIETVNWRVVVQGPTPEISLNSASEKSSMNPKPKNKRNVYFNQYSDYVLTPVYDRDQLSPGSVISGPAIIEERESTMVVTPNFSLTIDPFSNLILNSKGGRINDKNSDKRQYV